MALLKLICNTGAKLFVDQEFVSELQENKLCIAELSAGMYLVDVVSLIDEKIKVSFELRFDNDSQQILKRIDLAGEEKKCKQNELKSELMRNPNLSFYRNLARFEYNGLWGYVDSNYEIVVEPIYSSAEDFVNDFALVGKSFSEGIKYALIDTTGKNRMGVWFDELIFRNEKRLFVRRNNDLLSYDVLEGTLFTYNLSGEIKDDDLIPVLWENNYSKKGGYINLRGEVVLPFIYDQVSNFNEDGFAEVERFGYKRYITKEGQVCIYNTIYEIKSNHYYDYDLGHCLYLLDKEFDWCGPLERSHKDSLFMYNTFRMAVKKGDKWGYYSFWKDKGKKCLEEMVPCKYDAPLSNSQFNFVVMRDRNDCCIINLLDIKYKGGEKNGQYVYGKVGSELLRIESDTINPIIENEEHWINDDFHEDGGYWLSLFHVNNVVVEKKGQYGIFNKNTRKYVLPCEYNDVFWIGEDKVKSHTLYSKNHYIVEKNGFQAIIDNSGNIITSFEAIDIYPQGDFWVVRLDNKPNCYLYSIKDGLSDISYEEVEIEYDYDPWDEGLYFYLIKKNNKYGILNKEGKVLINNKYDAIKIRFVQGIMGFYVYENQKCGYYDTKGELLLDCVYDSIDCVDDSCFDRIFSVMLNGKKALYCHNKFISDFNFDKITSDYIWEEGYDENNKYFSETVFILSLDDRKFCLLNDSEKLIFDELFDCIEIDYITTNFISVEVKKDGNWYVKESKINV